jgi:multiple sugar transport system permease protein
MTIHGILLIGGMFFLLPLVWMICTSFKPLSQTMRLPENVLEAILPMGHRAAIGGTEYEVVLEREVPVRDVYSGVIDAESFLMSLTRGSAPSPGETATVALGGDADHVCIWKPGLAWAMDRHFWILALDRRKHTLVWKSPAPAPSAAPFSGYQRTVWQVSLDGNDRQVVLEHRLSQYSWIVQPQDSFPAGELALPFGKDTWDKNPAFSKQELARMNAVVRPGMTVLADDKNRFDPNTGTIKLQSGRVVPATLVRLITPVGQVGAGGSQSPISDLKSQTGDPQSTTGNPRLWLVREWRSEDTDPKEMSSNVIDVSRAWDILPEPAVRKVVRPIPENYAAALKRVHFGQSLWNTLFLCVMTVCGAAVSSVIVAYGFAFLEFRGNKLLFALTLATIMIPFTVTMIPVYLMYRQFGWIGTFKPLWVTSWFGSAFFIFLLRQFFLGLPKDLLDAARIDGCSELEILWNVVVPLSRPAIAMVALFTFLGTWKDFMGPMIYLNHPSQFTLSLSLQAFNSEHGGTPWHLLMAASTVFSLPLIVLFFITMKTFLKGIATTGMKG